MGVILKVFVSCRTEKHGEDAPEAADLYFSYGKTLLENAIAQSSVLGKEQAEDAIDGDKGACFLCCAFVSI